MAENKLQYVIEVDAAGGTAQLKQFGDAISQAQTRIASDAVHTELDKTAKLKAIGDKHLNDSILNIENLKKHWIGATVAIAAAMATINKAWSMAEASAGYLEQRRSLESLAASYGSSADQILKDLKRVSAGTIDMVTMVEKAGTAMMMGISPEKVSQLMEIARATARMTGQDVSQAFSDISLAVGRQSRMILDNLGIIVSVEKANEEYAASLGKTSSLLTDAEKKQAFMNATVKAGEELMARLGTQQDTVKDKMQRLEATLSNVKIELGVGLIRAASGVTGAFQSLSAASMAATAGIWKLIEAKQTLQTFVSWGEQERRHAEAASEAARNAASDWTQSLSLAAQAQDNFSLMVASTSELTAAAGAASDAAKRLQKEEKDAAEEAKKRAEAQKVATDYWKKEMDRQISVLQEWEKESVKIGVSITEAELTELERRRQYFAEFVQDEAKLAQWLADEKRAIMIRANNEQIALYTELIESGKREYADRLIELYREIEEANKAKNTLILKSEQQAQEIMEIRMQKHIDRIKQMIGEVSETAVETARETVGAIEGIYENSATASAAVAAPSFSPGAVTGGGTIDVVYGRTFFNDRAGAHAYQRQMEEMNRTLKQVQENTAKTAAAAAEQAAREAQRAYEEKRSLLDNAYGRYAAYIQAQERSTWGRVQYESEFYRLAEAFGSSQYFEESVNLLDEMLDVIQELDTIAQAQLEQQKQQTASLQAGSRSISDWLIDLSQGSLVPVQSAAGWASRFEELRTEAMADEARISDFLSYAQRYLEFEKAYGDSESYSQAYGSIVESVQDLGDWMDLASRLSQLGLGDNLGDISALITAFGNLGVSIGELKAAADTAQGSGLSALAATLGDSLPSAAGTASSLTGTLATTLQNTETPFGNVTAALNDMGSNVQSRLQVVSDFFTGLAERMGLTFNEASAGTAIGNLTKTEYTQAAKYVVQVVENTPYQPEMGYWDYGIPMTSIDDKWVVTRYARPATYKTIWSDGTVTVAGEGALTDGLTLAGEIGPEWVVPTYEPERSRFLESAPPEFWGNMGLGVQPGGGGATLDADAIGRSVGRQIAAALGNDADGKEIHVHLHIDGREIASVVADQYRQGNRNLIEQTKRRMQ